MDAARKESSPDAPVALIALTALVYIAGFAMVAAWFALVLMDQPAPGKGQQLGQRAPVCAICGVVERVGEFDGAAFSRNGDQNESIVVLLATLGGLKGETSSRVYETAVLHDDGTVRVVRESSAPQWKQGDRVRIVRGRIQPVALQAERN